MSDLSELRERRRALRYTLYTDAIMALVDQAVADERERLARLAGKLDLWTEQGDFHATLFEWLRSQTEASDEQLGRGDNRQK